MTMSILCRCPFCGKNFEMRVPYEQYLKYRDGELVQNAFPDFTPEEREMLISGMCLDCQRDFFENEE